MKNVFAFVLLAGVISLTSCEAETATEAEAKVEVSTPEVVEVDSTATEVKADSLIAE
ncbi:MAG: hypothetical protein ACK4ND_12010 [Cytophagaceae bacterium]